MHLCNKFRRNYSNMDCTVIQTSLTRFKMENTTRLQGSIPCSSPRMGLQRMVVKLHKVSIGKYTSQRASGRIFCNPVSLEEEFSALQSPDISRNDESDTDSSNEDDLDRPLSAEELKLLLTDSERLKLLKKLSEANQHNRFLKRQLQSREDELVSFKSDLAVAELEIEALVSLAEEIAKANIPEGTRKINGKYIQSHLLSRLQALKGKLKEQVKDVETAQPKEVPLFWMGVAESVQVMGSFDGWSLGEHLSPEYTGSYTQFSTTLLLRPGRYEIKFLVNGEWQLSPEYPTVGEGLTQNNLLVVE
nr:protein PTST, chloroplastic [Ipomoea batatas]